MERRAIFTALGTGEYIWGNAYLYRIADLDLSVAKNRFLKLDEICEAENWKPLGDAWNSLEFSACSQLLMDAIGFDIAFECSNVSCCKTFCITSSQNFVENLKVETLSEYQDLVSLK